MFIFNWIRALYDRVLALSSHPKAAWWLAAISFAESSFFPIPPDVLLLPVCLANRKRALFMAGVCTVASIAGGLVGYMIGAFAFESVGQAILNFYSAAEHYDKLQGWYNEYGSVMVFVAGLTPIPYKVITISSGVFQYPLLPFLLMSLASRGLRFGIEALIIMKFGEPAMALIDKHFNKLTIIGAILLVGGFLIVKLLLAH